MFWKTPALCFRPPLVLVRPLLFVPLLFVSFGLMHSHVKPAMHMRKGGGAGGGGAGGRGPEEAAGIAGRPPS